MAQVRAGCPLWETTREGVRRPGHPPATHGLGRRGGTRSTSPHTWSPSARKCIPRASSAARREAGRHIGYLTKYLTKSITEVIEPSTDRQREHADWLHAELSITPVPRPGARSGCSTASNPLGTTSKTVPGTVRRAGTSAKHPRPTRTASPGLAQVVGQDARGSQGRPESLCDTSIGGGRHREAGGGHVPAGVAQGQAPVTLECLLGRTCSCTRSPNEHAGRPNTTERCWPANGDPPGAPDVPTENFSNSSDGGLTRGKGGLVMGEVVATCSVVDQ